MSETYIVTNKFLFVRGKPDTKTGGTIRKMSQGEAFDVVEIITPTNNQKWGRLTDDNDVTQEYACLQIGNRYFARKSVANDTPTEPPALAVWVLSMDAWARSKGYTGPMP